MSAQCDRTGDAHLTLDYLRSGNFPFDDELRLRQRLSQAFTLRFPTSAPDTNPTISSHLDRAGCSCPSTPNAAAILAPIRKMPTEILSQIFDLTVHGSPSHSLPSFTANHDPDDDPSYQSLLISHVCYHWNLLITTIPALWTEVHVCLSSRRGWGNRSFVSSHYLLQQYLALSNGRSLTIKVHGAYFHDNWKHQRLVGTLLGEASRWSKVEADWSLLPYLRLRGASAQEHLTGAEFVVGTMDLGFEVGPGVTGGLVGADDEDNTLFLRSLTLGGRLDAYTFLMTGLMSPHFSPSVLSFLTRMEVGGRAASYVIGILNVCHNLESLTVWEPRGICHFVGDPITSMLGELHVHLLSHQPTSSSSPSSNPTLSAIFRSVHLPRLHTLHLTDGRAKTVQGDVGLIPFPDANVGTLLGTSNPPIRHFSTQGLHIESVTGFMNFLSGMKGLRQLEVGLTLTSQSEATFLETSIDEARKDGSLLCLKDVLVV